MFRRVSALSRELFGQAAQVFILAWAVIRLVSQLRVLDFEVFHLLVEFIEVFALLVFLVLWHFQLIWVLL